MHDEIRLSWRRSATAGAHDFIAQHAVTDVDLTDHRSGDADHLTLDDDRFTDARLRVSGAGH